MLKERPILFSGEMVRAILEGHKTQTRRVIRKKKAHGGVLPYYKPTVDLTQFITIDDDCPYGQLGDLLWVREKFTLECPYGHTDECDNPDHVIYWATESQVVRESITTRWRASIHMPRWASRITLEVNDIRAERVQDITEVDAIAEGIGKNHPYAIPTEIAKHPHMTYLTQQFAQLWNSINAKRGFGWEINPWVWVIGFKLI